MARAQRQSERRQKQRLRQQAYRTRLKSERRPSRDDIARVLLHLVITRSVAKGEIKSLERYCDVIVDALARQGFAPDHCHDVFGDLVDKYTKADWHFRRKVHLGSASDPNAVGETEPAV